MAQQSSALDSWSTIADEPSARHTIAGVIPLVLAGVGSIGVAPFAVIRWMDGEYVVAIMDTVIVVGLLTLGTYVYRTRKVRVASVLIAIMCVAGVLVSVRALGPQQVFWTFPSLLVCFYLTRPREAIVLSLTMVAVVVLLLYDGLEPAHLVAYVVTALVVTAFAFGFSVINNRQQEKLIMLATKDPLTGAGNRRAFIEKIETIIERFRRSRVPSSLVMIDIDHFKEVNDVHGHAVGDEVLVKVAKLIDSRIRKSDRQYRVGGEEFVIVFDGEGLRAAAKFAEDLRARVEGHELARGVSVTLSIGVAELRAQESDDGWMHRADEAMYKAKRSGRNQVILAE